jgi:hypothetical protein
MENIAFGWAVLSTGAAWSYRRRKQNAEEHTEQEGNRPIRRRNSRSELKETSQFQH